MKNFLASVFALFFLNVALAQDVVKFTAHIKNPNGDVIYIKDQKDKVVKEITGKNGKFKSSFSVTEGMYVFYDGTEYTQLFLKNGFDLTLKMDAKEFDESIVYTGKGSKENNFLAQKVLEEETIGEKVAAITTEDELNKFIEDQKNKDFKTLEEDGFEKKFVSLEKIAVVNNLMGIKQMFKAEKAKAKMNGVAAPDFEYVSIDDKKVKLSDFKGKYVYIDVWATWCGPCRAEIPHLKKLEEHFHGKNIEFVSISVDYDKDFEKWKKFVKEKQLGGTQLYADKNWESTFIQSFGINSIPRFILIDPSGNVVSSDESRPSEVKLQEKLDGLLK